MTTSPLHGRIKQSACQWCYDKLPLPDLARHCAQLGLHSIELVDPRDWPVLQQHGLICAMTPSHTITTGFNRPENHPACAAAVTQAIDATAAAGFPNVICFAGNRAGLSDAAGLANCAAGLRDLAAYAEQKRVTLCMELLNSKRDHPDYQCDHTAWGVELCQRIGSPRFKLLYDIYHTQIMEGDVIATLRANIQYIGHIHTGGVPDRQEIDDTQELNYPAIMRALVAAGYQGYVGQEFQPARSPLDSLTAAVRLCDV